MSALEQTRDLQYWQSRARLIRPETRAFIDGKFVAASDGRTFQSVNPATGEPIAEVARGTPQDADRAVAAARKSFRAGTWSRMNPRARMDVTYSFARITNEHRAEFALLDCLDMGKPI